MARRPIPKSECRQLLRADARSRLPLRRGSQIFGRDHGRNALDTIADFNLAPPIVGRFDLGMGGINANRALRMWQDKRPILVLPKIALTSFKAMAVDRLVVTQ
jgi:hypothetical protein